MEEQMMETAKTQTAAVIDAYYESWRGGIESFDETGVTAILAEDLNFEGPIAGKRRGAAGFVGGLRRFVEGLRAPVVMLQRVDSGDSGATLYDADLPRGTMRFAEFFTARDGRIRSIRLLYDAARYRELGGR